MAWQNNTAELRGIQSGAAERSHTGRGIEYYRFSLLSRRLSGAVDRVPVILAQNQLALLPGAGKRVRVRGEMRSFNNRSGSGSRLQLFVFAQELMSAEEESEDQNEITLTGTVCKEPVWRKTPMGREICDIMLAVGRRYGRTDYIPCIAWGRNAGTAAEMERGADVSLVGRFQSRDYLKQLDHGRETRTAYEVSVTGFFN